MGCEDKELDVAGSSPGCRKTAVPALIPVEGRWHSSRQGVRVLQQQPLLGSQAHATWTPLSQVSTRQITPRHIRDAISPLQSFCLHLLVPYFALTDFRRRLSPEHPWRWLGSPSPAAQAPFHAGHGWLRAAEAGTTNDKWHAAQNNAAAQTYLRSAL